MNLILNCEICYFKQDSKTLKSSNLKMKNEIHFYVLLLINNKVRDINLRKKKTNKFQYDEIINEITYQIILL